MSPRILIVGAGSVGARHADNLRELGAQTGAVDPRKDRRAAFAERFASPVFAGLPEALDAGGWDGAAICSPTRFHVEQGLACLEAGLPLLLEKPVAMDLESARRLAQGAERCERPVLLGYTWRWWPPLQRVRTELAAGRIGRVLSASFVMSAHLEDWHPWEPLEDFFMAHAELGGGALLDESHWLDQMLWLLGMPHTISGRVEKISALPISADDNVDLLARFEDGRRVHLHLDLYGRPHRKEIRFVGETGTLLWTENPNRIAVAGDAEGTWQEIGFDCARNDMFMAVARDFLALLEAPERRPACTLEEGLQVMRMIEAARESSAGGREVELR